MRLFCFTVLCYVSGHFDVQAAALTGSWTLADFEAAKGKRRDKFLGSDPMFNKGGKNGGGAAQEVVVTEYKMTTMTHVKTGDEKTARLSSPGKAETESFYKSSPISHITAREREEIAIVSS